MSDDFLEPGVFGKFLMGLLTIAFTAWAWVVKGASAQVLNELREMRKQIDINSQRLSRLEGEIGMKENRHDLAN
jgi:hypothetical protein